MMVGYDLKKNDLTGIQVVSHKETPGVGSRVTEDQFTMNFKGLPVDVKFSGGPCPGDIDAISGASYSSAGVCEAVKNSVAIYPKVKEKIKTK